MTVALDKKRFGPWALVTGASSGIGKEFAQQIAASGTNIVLVARREDLLNEVGVRISYAGAILRPMKVEEIAEVVAKLPPDQLARFRRWFTAFEAARPDHAEELDSTAT